MDTLADARAHYEAIGESGVTGVIHADIEMSQCLVAMKDPEKAEIIMRKAHEVRGCCLPLRACWPRGIATRIRCFSAGPRRPGCGTEPTWPCPATTERQGFDDMSTADPRNP